jgi:hypothetical protein
MDIVEKCIPTSDKRVTYLNQFPQKEVELEMLELTLYLRNELGVSLSNFLE